MANTPKKIKTTTTPPQASAKKIKNAEVAKPTKTTRKGIEIVAKVKEPTKAKTTTAKPRKTAPKKEKVVAISQPSIASREMIEQVAYLKWVQRGYQHGYALEDWIKAERELLDRAS